MIGTVIGGYKLVRKLGSGSTGIVYRAEDATGRPAVVKLIHVDHIRTETIEAAFAEARSAAALGHPNITVMHGAGFEGDGAAYIVTEFLEGETLADRLARSPLEVDDAVRIIVQVVSALSAAHQMDIVHRNIKPSNIIIVPDPAVPGGERVKILDFGISALAGELKPSSVLTPSGTVIGTPEFLAPEQCEGAADKIDGRTDLYAVGCMLFAMLCGRPPFLGELAGDVMAAQINDAPARPRAHEPKISHELEALILRLLEKEPRARYESADELRGALRQFAVGRAGPRPASKPIAPAKKAAKKRAGSAASPAIDPAASASAAIVPAAVATAPPRPVARAATAPPGVPARALTAPPGTAARTSSRSTILIVAGVVSLAGGGIGALLVSASSSPTPKEKPAATPTVVSAPPDATLIDAPPEPPSANPWIRIEAPSFRLTLGVTADQPSRVTGFRPERLVTSPVTAYEIQQHEVTWGEIEAFLSASAANPGFELDLEPPELEDGVEPSQMPVTGLPQPVAAAYCASIGGALPSEEQWEYAARGAQLLRWPQGQEPPSAEKARVYRGRRAKVGAIGIAEEDRTASDPPLFDMAGNAREWTADLYRADTLEGKDEEVSDKGAIFAVRGLPLAKSEPRELPTVGLAFRSPLCGDGECLKKTAKERALVGFRCAREGAR